MAPRATKRVVIVRSRRGEILFTIPIAAALPHSLGEIRHGRTYLLENPGCGREAT
jgi:hypothetical protein